jgi:hypothetical protein
MAIIYTYPVKTTPNANDLILISDSQDSNKTKQVKISTLPGGSGSGVSSVTSANTAITVADATTTPVLTSIAYSGGTNIGHVPTGSGNSATVYLDGTGNWSTPSGSGGTPDNPANSVQFNNAGAFGGSANLTFSTNTLAVTHTVDIKGDGTNAGKLKIYCPNTTTPHAVTIEGPAHNGASDYTLKLPSPAPSNQQILQSDGSGNLTWINTPSSGGGGSVDSVNTTDGTYINLTPNSATTGAVTVTADLSAADGTSDTTTRFLSKDNTWDVPSYTTAYSLPLASSSARGGVKIVSSRDVSPLQSPSTDANRDYQVQINTNASHAEQLFVNVPWADTNIGGTNLALTNNRTLNFYTDTSDKSLTFIGSDVSGSKTLFKFDTVGTGPPRFTIGDTTSAYEGTLDITGNGSGRTGKINLYNAAGTYSINIQAPVTFGANSDIAYVLPNIQGTANTYLKNNGSGVLSWDTPTGGGSLGFAPLEIYSANDNSTASYIYYMVAVCDVDFTVNKCKVAVTSGTDPVYVAVYSMNYGSLQSSTLSFLGALNNSGSLTGVNELSLSDAAFSLTAGQTICIGVSTSCQLASGVGINNTALGLMATSGGGSALPTTPDFEGLGSANRRPAIHFYAS